MKKRPIHPLDYQTEFNLLIREGLDPRQAAHCLHHLRQNKRAPLRSQAETNHAPLQLLLPGTRK